MAQFFITSSLADKDKVYVKFRLSYRLISLYNLLKVSLNFI